MKVLIVTPYVTIDGIARFEKNRTGFGHMVWLISRAMTSFGIDVSVLAKSGFGKKVTIDNVTILPNSPLAIMRAVLVGIPKYEFSCVFEKSLLKNFYDYLSARRTIRMTKGGYEVVHLNGVNDINRAVISALRFSHVGLVLTLHGFRNPEVDEYSDEFQVVRECLEAGGVVTTISSGVRSKIVSLLRDVLLEQRVVVVCNGVFSDRDIRKFITLEEKFSFYHLLIIGNVTANKNQIQAARALLLIDPALKKKIKLHIVGNENDGGELRNFVSENNLSDVVIMHGYLKRDNISELYRIASGILSVSKMEGFGMPLCEAMFYGVPIGMFADLDAVADIYSDGCGVLIKNRDDLSVAEAIETLTASNWDRDAIRNNAAKFTFEEMGMRYKKAYEMSLR